ncbi:MAG TPA: SRPBCC family protein [Pyrinomonadaceae bacterium]|nr:SRPBCC family protein [Pyrinomonadaceae bacterium]
MNKGLSLMSAAGVGAGLMYLFDPDRGKRRRGLVQNKVTHLARVASDAGGKTKRDIRNHLIGAFAEVESLFIEDQPPSDAVLEARVRSRLGRIVSHPGAVGVKAVDGLVILTGQILAAEAHPLLDSVIAIRGVKNIENDLEIHEHADDIPALQGGRKRQGARFGPLKTNWSPTTRLMAAAAGSALMIYGARRRGLIGSAVSSAGLGILMRGLTNFETDRLLGLYEGRKVIDIQKTIDIGAPVDRVFTYWSHPENFPEFMTHVVEVRRIGDGLYRWSVGGPAGLTVHWDAQITDLEFNKLLAWKSLPGSMVGQRGVTRFTSNPDGSTRIDVKMSYNPPAGALGHAIAELFGVDPKQEMDDDLMRMKSFLETGKPPHDAWLHVQPAAAHVQ